MDVRDYVKVLRRRWAYVVLTTLVFAGLAFGATAASAKVYTATTSSFVKVADSSSSDPSAIYQQSQFTVQRLKSYTQLVSSPLVLDPVIKRMGLNLTSKQLAKKLTASSPTDTVVLKVQVTDKSPTQAANIANEVAAQLATQIEDLETPTGKTTSTVKVTMTDPATPPSNPSSPRPTFNLAVGVLLGLAIGIILAIVREQFNNAVESAAEMEEMTGSSPLGQVLHNGNSKKPLVALDTHEVLSEAFRSIRVNLRFVDVDNPPRTVVITSAAPKEGKTTVTCNLAITLANSGARVCVVDADLRRPWVGEVLGIDNAAGLTDVLAGEHELQDVLVPWRHGLLTVLTSGSIPPDPSVLVSSKAMAHVIDKLSADFDIVLIDSPPLLPVTDAAALGDLCDGVILVARRGKTQRQHLQTAVANLERANVHLLGTILNDVRPGRGPLGHAYSGYTPRTAPTEPTPVPTPVRGSLGGDAEHVPVAATRRGRLVTADDESDVHIKRPIAAAADARAIAKHASDKLPRNRVAGVRRNSRYTP